MCVNNTEGNPKSTIPQGQTPPVQQFLPPAGARAATPNGNTMGQWSTGLCGCFEDVSSCCVTCWCPCIPFGQNVEIIEKGTTSCAHAGIIYYCLSHFGCACFYTCTYRTKLRANFKLPKEPCGDFFVHCFCLPCAICQEYRELKNHGLNPSHGWIANAQKWDKAVSCTVPPSFAGGMAR